MNNAFYLALEFIKTRLIENPLVNTCIFGRTDEKDLYSKNIYPLVHINPRSAGFNGAVSIFKFEVAVLDQRDLSKNFIDYDKFYDSNIQDNLNLCYSILNDLVLHLKSQNNSDIIELLSVSDAMPVLYKDNNILDGWFVEVAIMIPNNQSSC